MYFVPTGVISVRGRNAEVETAERACLCWSAADKSSASRASNGIALHSPSPIDQAAFPSLPYRAAMTNMRAYACDSLHVTHCILQPADRQAIRSHNMLSHSLARPGYMQFAYAHVKQRCEGSARPQHTATTVL